MEKHMSSYEQMLIEKRANVWEQAKGLLDHAAEEKRELDATEQASYNQMTADLADLRSTIEKLKSDRETAAASEAALRDLAKSPVDEERNGHRPSSEDKAAELRSFLKGERNLIDFRGTPEDIRSINEYRSGLSGLTQGAGAATMPTNFYNKLWAHLINASEFLKSGITVLQTDNGDTLQLPTTTAHSTASWTAQQATISESDPAFVQRSLSAYKAALLIQVAQELVDDTGVDLEGYLAMQAGRAVGNLVGQGLVVGTGSTQPTGITTQTTAGVTGGTGVTGHMTFDDVINLYYSVIPQYRSSKAAAFVTADASIGYLRTLKDSYGRYLWQPGLTLGTPDTILGAPVIQEVWMPAIGLNNKSLIFGDLSAYFARVVNGIRFEQSREFAFNTDQITFRCVLRADGTLVDQTGAVKHFVGGAS
jgi:HK97 family phage major capsid protein